MNRIYRSISNETLRFLQELANREFRAFFDRNPEAAEYYEDRFLAACLCQGAAWHYVGKGDGVKDFDIHLFFWQHPDRKIISRLPKAYREDVPGFGTRRCDVLKTVIPKRIPRTEGPVDEILKSYLNSTPTKTAHHLAEKAVVGLVPEDIFGEVIWD